MLKDNLAHSGFDSAGVPQFHRNRIRRKLHTHGTVEAVRQPNYEAVFASFFYDDLTLGENTMHTAGCFSPRLFSPAVRSTSDAPKTIYMFWNSSC
jgi:hypothetical protein